MKAPGRVTPFELMMLADDRDTHPMTTVAELALAGELQREPLEIALAGALRRHPLLSARLKGSLAGRPRWVVETPRPRLVWLETPVPSGEPDGRIDLWRESGLRVRAWSGRGRSGLVFRVHHACCDATGLFQFVDDVLTLYARQAGAPDVPPLRPLDDGLLSERGRFGPGVPDGERPAAGAGAVFWSELRALARGATPVVGAGGGADWAELLLARLAPEAVAGLGRVAARVAASVNDVLLRDLFLTLADWNLRRGTSGGLTLLVPWDLRQARHEAMPAANHIGYALLRRGPGELADPERLLAGLTEARRYIRANQAARWFVDGLALAARLPGLVALLARRRTCFASAVLSSFDKPARRLGVGWPRRDGRLSLAGLSVESMAVWPPLRPSTHVAFGALRETGRLTLSLRVDPAALSASAGRELLDDYVTRLSRTAGTAGAAA